jgi:hypothetical protein
MITFVRVLGSSMQPTLLGGDVLLARRLDRPPRVGEVVLARAPQGVVVKRVVGVSPAGVSLGIERPVAPADVTARVLLAWTPGGLPRRVR